MKVFDYINNLQIGRNARYVNSNFDFYHLDNQDEKVSVLESVPFGCKMNSYDKLATCLESGIIQIFDCSCSSQTRLQLQWQAHENAILDVEWSDLDSNILFSASGDMLVSKWNIESQQRILDLKGHKASVRALSCHDESNDLLLSCSRDGSIRAWDTRSGDCLFDLVHAHQRQTQTPKRRQSLSKLNSAVTCVQFSHSSMQKFYSAGSTDGCVKLWDMRNTKIVLDKSDECLFDKISGFTSISQTTTGSNLYVSCMNNLIYEFNPVTLECKRSIGATSFENKSFYSQIQISNNNRYLASTSSTTGDLFIWDLHNYETCFRLEAHWKQCSGLAWTCNDQHIISISDDLKIRKRSDRYWIENEINDAEKERQKHVHKTVPVKPIITDIEQETANTDENKSCASASASKKRTRWKDLREFFQPKKVAKTQF